MAVAVPIRPRPMSPMVFPMSSTPIRSEYFRPQSPFLTALSADAILLVIESIMATVISATVTVRASGVLRTTFPNSRAAGRSTWSHPMPWTPIALSLGLEAIISRVTRIPPRVINPSAEGIAVARASSLLPSGNWMTLTFRLSRSLTPTSLIGSVMTTVHWGKLNPKRVGGNGYEA